MNTNGCEWQTVINAIPCLAWGMILLTTLYLMIKVVVPPLIKNHHERKMKEEAFSHEILWAVLKKTETCSNESLSNKINDLTKENEELKRKLEVELSRHQEQIEQLEE